MIKRISRLNTHGFTLIEMIVALAVISILVMIALPAYQRMQAAAKYREESRGIASALRDARSRAVSQNLEHRVVFDVDQKQYQIERGNRSSGSSSWTAISNTEKVFVPGVLMGSTDACTSVTDVTIQFNPTGTANAGILCVMDGDGNERFKIGVLGTDTATGRVVIE